MKSSLMSGKSLGGCGIVLAATLAILIPNAPREALAKGGAFHLFSAAQATTVTSPRTEATTETHSPTILGSCGGRRIRDPNTHRCRGPADFGN
ncbi:MAG: hypothetical protein WCD69_14235 [Xanthobacteraceae bacterium]